MVRTLVVTAALTAVGGFTAGLLFYGKAKVANTSVSTVTTVTPKAVAAAAVPDATGVVTALQRFGLRPGDVTADRETPALAVAPDGTVVLAWASQAEVGDNERTLYLCRSSDQGTTFEAPVAWRKIPIYRYTSGSATRKMAYSTHVLPRLTATRDAVVLGWVEAIDGGPTVRYFVARSRDGGKTFSDPVAVHGDGASRPGFTTLAADLDGGLACGWIDGRNQVPLPFFSACPADSEGFTSEQLVFGGPDGKGICPCCDVAVAVAPAPERTAFVAFRNSDSGHRDIWLARSGNGASAFAAPIAISPEHWTFNGCPHDAPSLTVAGDRLHVAWMDAHTGTGRVYHAMTPIAEASFHPRPLNASGQGAQGHPRLAADRAGRVHAVWDEGLAPDTPAATKGKPTSEHQHQHGAPTAGGAGRAIVYAVSRDGGESFTPAHRLIPSPGVYQLQPSLTVGPDGTVFVAWNEIDQDGKHVVLARLARPAEESARQ